MPHDDKRAYLWIRLEVTTERNRFTNLHIFRRFIRGERSDSEQERKDLFHQQASNEPACVDLTGDVQWKWSKRPCLRAMARVA